jgi:hypothetical protein
MWLPPRAIKKWRAAGCGCFRSGEKEDGSPAEPTEEEIRTITGNPSRLAVGAAGWRW